MNPRIGVIGFGVAGKAAIEFLCDYWSTLSFTAFSENPSITVWDKRIIRDDEKEQFKKNSIIYFSETECSLEHFIEKVQFVIPSPSIDMRPFEKYKKKIISELDIFSSLCTIPTIAITGSIGKTSTRHLLANCLAHLPISAHESTTIFTKPLEAGNIGRGLLGDIKRLASSTIAVLELSSFQLELSALFAPDIALITNLHANHLDRHSTIEEYLKAKLMLIAFQKSDQCALLPTSILLPPLRDTTIPLLERSAAKKCFIHHGPLDKKIKSLIESWSDTIFFMNDEGCHVYYQGHSAQLLEWNYIPTITYRENWLSIISMLYTLGYDLSLVSQLLTQTSLHLEPHRLEPCGTIKGVTCYNDSKATIIEATEAALTKLSFNKKPIILIVGGVNHAGNRDNLAKKLSSFSYLKKVVCFGNECNFFPMAQRCNSLEDALKKALDASKPGDQLLFSPNGASTDLFVNYVERGNIFKKLVETYEQKNI